MKHKYKNIIVLSLISLFFSSDFIEKLPSRDYGSWILLSDEKISVWYLNQEREIPWCRASAIYPFASDEIYNVLKDLPNYKNIFDRVTESEVLEDNIVYIRLDMPYFLADRDYTIKYIESSTNTDIVFQFYSVIHPNSPDNKGSVTLPRAAGEWILSAIPGKGTKVTYTWNGELLGMFPTSSLHTAWEEQGTEVLTWLYQYLKKNKGN